MEATASHIRTQAPGIYSHELVETIFARPYARIGHLIDAGIAKRVSASRYLKQLAALGILEEEKVGRDKVFIHRKYMQLLGNDGHDFTPYPRSAK